VTYAGLAGRRTTGVAGAKWELSVRPGRFNKRRLRLVVSVIGSIGGRIASNLCFRQLARLPQLTGHARGGSGESPPDSAMGKK
jgi:hypothetical protein